MLRFPLTAASPNPVTLSLSPSPPTGSQRLGCRERPAGLAVGRQRWSDLLFAHWVVDAAAIQATLPPGLFVDTFAGCAYLGIVPFFMERVRPAGLPPVPFLSWFLELNVRTYVHDAAGNPGVWFYSLDCNQPLAVALARRFFHLPYFYADMTAARSGGSIRYRCRRQGGAGVTSEFRWERQSAGDPAAPDTLEFFLLERYRLFAADRTGRLFRGRVHHAPYRYYRPRAGMVSADPAQPLGFGLPAEPVSVLGALPVDVAIFPLQSDPTPAARSRP